MQYGTDDSTEKRIRKTKQAKYKRTKGGKITKTKDLTDANNLELQPMRITLPNGKNKVRCTNQGK